MPRYLFSGLLLIFVSLFVWHCGTDEDTIIEVGALSVSKSEVLDALKQKYPKQIDFTDVDLSTKKDLLAPLIQKKLRLNEAYELNLDQEATYRQKFDQYQMRLVGNLYFEKVVVDKLVSEEMLEDYFKRQGTEIKASHILIAYEKSPRSVKRTLEEAGKIALDVKKQLDEGADFTALVQKYSDDPSAQKNKGDLGYFSWGRMVGPFQEAAWDLEIGQISDPVKTQFGYHIIRLDDRRNSAGQDETRSLTAIRRAKQTITRSFGDSLRTLWNNHYKQLCDDYDYQIYEDQIDEFADSLKTIIKDRPLNDEVFTPDFTAIKFAEWDGSEITVQSLLDKYGDRIAQMLGSFREPQNLRKEIDRISMDGLVLKDAEKLGLLDDAFVVNELKLFEENSLEKDAERVSVQEKTVVSEEEAKEYYTANPQKFESPEEIEIWVIDIKDKDLAAKVARKAKEGQDFSTLAKTYSEDNRLKTKGGYLGFKPKNGRGSISVEAFKIGSGGKIGGPVRYGRYWSVVKTGKMKEKSVKPFEEVKRRVESLVKNDKVNEIKLAWEKELKEKYKVVIDEEKLRNL